MNRIALGFIFGMAAATAVAEIAPARQILGIHLAMTREEAQARLKEIGAFVRDERKQQEIWQVRGESFSHVIVGFEKEGKLRFVTAVARNDKEAKRVPYAKAGALKQARQAGDVKINNFNYQWDLPAGKGQPQTTVMARGRDPEFLDTYTLKRVGGDAAERENE